MVKSRLGKIVGIALHPRKAFFVIGIRGGWRFLNDETYLSLMYYCKFKKKLNLQMPRAFNEKLQWLKLNYKNPLHTGLVDKYEVKKQVSDMIGEEYIVPTIGVYDSFEDIDFDTLPKAFVLKCTHDSGGLVICRDKEKMDIGRVKKKINQSLKRNYYYVGREWAYKNVKPRIIAEKYMSDEFDGCIEGDEKLGLRDYKFYCFNGTPQFLYVSEGLDNHATAKISFLTMDWEFAPFQREDFLTFKTLPRKPRLFDKMIEIAKTLSQGEPFMRVDLYCINEKIYFSEITFCPCSGFMPLEPEEYDIEIGTYLKT